MAQIAGWMLLLGALLVARDGRAAPLPGFAPVDVCGVIRSYDWSPATVVPPRPGASGTLGQERHFPARFRVVIERYTGIDDATATRINRLLGLAENQDAGSTRLLLLLPGEDAALLAGIRSLCVRGFRIWGDEGGTWTGFRALELDPDGADR